MLRYKILLLLLLACVCSRAAAQELFVFAEPASNMPAKSIGVRMSNWLMEDGDKINYHLFPEIMFGVSKRLMLHLDGYFSNRAGTFSAEGGGVYAKYRFYSDDKVFRHFRMAAFGRASTNNSAIDQEWIVTNGYNTGYQLGLIGTQLLHKTALSATAYYERTLDNTGGQEFLSPAGNKAINYTFSAGRLVLPKKYIGYKQTNVNLMLELLGQTLTGNGSSLLDVAPSVQFIFNSQTRVDIGYRHEVYSNIQRTAPNGVLLRVEHLLYNLI